MTWKLEADYAPGALPMKEEDRRAWLAHTLMALVHELQIAPADLPSVPFERIAALHTANPLEYRRVAVPLRQMAEHGFMVTSPKITRSAADFTKPCYTAGRRRNA